jgi:hypothetical protein
VSNRLALIVVAALVAGAPTAPAGAASTGLAYDSVSKFSPGGDPSSFAPGSFQSDFQTASQPVPAQSHGGLFGGIANAVGGMNSMMRMMQTGTAERHYVAGSKERTDSLSTQTATIVDCAARTLTTLDLAKRTYRVVSLDATPEPVTHTNHAAPGPMATDDGSKVALTLTSKSLGPKTIESIPTNGYDSNVQMTVTKPGQAPQTMDLNMLAYYSAFAQPEPVCPRPSYLAMAGGPPMMAGFGFLQRALHAPNGDSRFTVNASGPALPSGKLSLFDVMTMQGQAQGRGGMVMIAERGHVRPVNDNDAVFSVPSDFTKLP